MHCTINRTRGSRVSEERVLRHFKVPSPPINIYLMTCLCVYNNYNKIFFVSNAKQWYQTSQRISYVHTQIINCFEILLLTYITCIYFMLTRGDMVGPWENVIYIILCGRFVVDDKIFGTHIHTQSFSHSYSFLPCTRTHVRILSHFIDILCYCAFLLYAFSYI